MIQNECTAADIDDNDLKSRKEKQANEMKCVRAKKQR